ncbi:MAG: fasciclin domain-containing protein [Hyphomonadaceae bacterium]|nr:fasciclin domain-containing protein [Hyphomonadaceae bacterium]
MTPARLLSLCALALAAFVCIAPAAAQPPADAVLIEVTETAPRAEGNVLEVAAATGQFQTFLRAVEAAGFEETLSGEGPFTLFAPTDSAFEDLGQAELQRLLDPRHHEELLALLAYHVVPQRVTSASASGEVVREQTSGGYQVQIDGRDGLRVNDQLVVAPDINASNGVIQGINAVLAPPVMVAQR